MIKKIYYKKKLYAIIIPKKFTTPGINFFTPDDYSQQIGYINYKKGHKIIPHIHKKVSRIIYQTNEVLFIKKGRIRIDFFEDNLKRNYFGSKILKTGDTILIAKGGHGFEILDNCEMIEVKQGPFLNTNVDKTKFQKEIKKIKIIK
jgi:hypothetical protein|tara:strand:- start:3378 stop:3815 length:438 start_codon:yes stop_codon:yes gene_type:complete